MQLPIAAWIAFGTGLGALVALMWSGWRRQRRHLRTGDLGVISDQWIAQHRASSYDPRQ
jgi:hypothetical protein